MTRYRAIAFCLALATLPGWPEPSPGDERHSEARVQSSKPRARPSLEVFYIPREDLSRAPGYSDAGVFLPLSELLALAREAQRPGDAEARPGSIYCRSIHLKGVLTSALALEGQVSFEVPWEGWSATLIDDGVMPWTAQKTTTDTLAFLARLDGNTYLFAKGPSRGTLHVRAFLPVRFSNSQATLFLGRFFAPCRIDMDLGPNAELVSATIPAATQEARGELETPERVTIWPTQEQATLVHLRHRAPLRAPPGLRVKLTRTIEVVGAGLEVADDLVLEDRFSAGAPLRVSLPGGMRLLRAETRGPVRLEASAEVLKLTPLRETDTLAFRAVFVAELQNERARLGKWSFPALTQTATLTLRSSEQYTPVLRTGDGPHPLSSLLIPVGGTRLERRYECWGPLPPLEVALVHLAPPRPPIVSATLAIARNEATAHYDVQFADKNRTELRFCAPPDWILTDLEARTGEGILPYELQQQEMGWWRVAWDPVRPPERIHLMLHCVGAWGAPGTTAELALPMVCFDGPRPSAYEMVVSWPEEIEARSRNLWDLAIVPIEEAAWAHQGREQGQQKTKGKQLALRATSDAPRGLLAIRGRDTDIHATVVSALSIAEDRATARAMIAFTVRLAPTNTFRFSLPAGTGRVVRIHGEGIRETTLSAGAEGDEWTIVTQQGVLGTYELTLEWPLRARPVEEPIVAPEIRVLGVSSQRGFLVLEGSETLRLTAETENLAEADLSELPPVPWARESRALTVYRYIQPPFLLQINAEKFEPEPPLKALVRESDLTKTISPEGERLTEVNYAVAPTTDRQFFEVRLPDGAQVWSVLVDGEGVVPARRPIPDGGVLLLVPLPAISAGAADTLVTVLYREKADPLTDITRLTFAEPALSVPTNQTIWHLNLPPGFEYLTFAGTMARTVAAREPAAHFFRTAYYPHRLVFMESSVGVILFLTLLGILAVFIVRNPKRLIEIASRPIGLRSRGIGREYEPRGEDEEPEARAERPEEGIARPRPLGCIWRALGLFAVAFVILILAAIAVPNFLEAQVRSKVSRVRTDMRALATAIEAYYVDNNIYPHRAELLWQGPVKYIASPSADPFAGAYAVSDASGRPHFRYLRDEKGFNWLIYSLGPDGVDDGGQISYDPTNGTVSAGDIIRIKTGAPSTFSPKYTELRKREERARAAVAMRPAPTPKATPAPAKPTPRPAPIVSAIPDVVVSDAEGKVPAAQVVLPEALALEGVPSPPRRAGLLSLKIEIPEGGIQRRFETLGGESRMEIRLLEWGRFRRLCFIVWMAAFLLMVGAWLIHWRVFRIAFIAGVGVTLLLPVAFQTAWVTFFNAAFQGVLFSLVVPLLSLLWGQINRYLHGGPASAAFLAMMLAFSVSAGAALPGGSSSTLAGKPPVRILVPYDLSDVRLTEAPTPSTSVSTERRPVADVHGVPKEDPLAFISKEDFTRLWNAARREPARSSKPGPILADIRLEGTLAPEKSTVEGEISFLAANPADTPATLTLSLAGLTLGEWSAAASGAVLESRPGGLILHMAANWIGTVSGRFVLPCETQGASGSLRVEFPDAATGIWRVKIPYPEVAAQGPGAKGCVSERLDGASALIGPVRPGVLDLSWAALRAGGAGTLPERTRRTAGRAAIHEWQAEIDTCVTWPTLSGAKWRSAIELRSTELGKSLPSEVRFALDRDLRIFSARGEELLGASVETPTDSATSPAAQKSEIVLRLAESPSARIVLEGTVAAPIERPKTRDLMQEWLVPGIRAPEGVEARTRLRLEIADQIEVLSVQPRLLERRSTDGTLQGYFVQSYETTALDWEARVELRRLQATFTAEVSELFAPIDGFLRQAAIIGLSPRVGLLHECIIDLPPDVRVLTLQGQAVSGWVQSDRMVLVAFERPIEQPSHLQLNATSDLPAPDPSQVGTERQEVEAETEATGLTISPLSVRGAVQTRRSAVVFVPADIELAEANLAGATPRPPTKEDEHLARLALEGAGARRAGPAGALRAYVLESNEPLRFGLKPIDATSLDTVYNRVTVGEGLQSLDCIVRAEPRRGRLRKVEALLLLPVPDPGAATRLQASGPALRGVRTELVSERVLRVVAELAAPQTQPVNIHFLLDQPLVLEEGDTVRTMVFTPVRKAGARAFLLLRRAFEGELTPANMSGARAIDPASVKWPDGAFRALASDRMFELAIAAHTGPSLAITRHAREKALRAVVEVMRQRTILTADGVERNELEIVLQNQSEQFLKIALPYPKDRMTIYETQVASRVVKATFAIEGGRDVLLVPLIRTGLLDPELTVRVAYTVDGGVPLEGSGEREQRLPDILGGVPIAQSALVLMLPQNFSYSNFEGSLNQVELVDLEVGEALREARQVERLSELALTGKDEFQRKAFAKLMELKPSVSAEIKAAKQISDAQARELQRLPVGARTKGRQEQLTKERGLVLQQAEEVAQKTLLNIERLDQLVQAQAAPPVAREAIIPEAPPPPAIPAITFPRVGNVFVFRQLQGVGFVTFQYSSRESAERRNDVLFAMVLTLLVAALTFTSHHLFATVNRVMLIVVVLSLIAIIFRVALDVAIPAVAVALLVLWMRRKRLLSLTT